MVSVTEREVLEGLFKQDKEQLDVGCFCIMRTIDGLYDAFEQKDAIAAKYKNNRNNIDNSRPHE